MFRYTRPIILFETDRRDICSIFKFQRLLVLRQDEASKNGLYLESIYVPCLVTIYVLLAASYFLPRCNVPYLSCYVLCKCMIKEIPISMYIICPLIDTRCQLHSLPELFATDHLLASSILIEDVVERWW